jgi:hypothetical protein
MAPRAGSRHSFSLGVLAPEGRRLLTEREPFRFREFPDNRPHRVVEGDTLWGLAGLYFAPLPRACGFWLQTVAPCLLTTPHPISQPYGILLHGCEPLPS